MNLGVTTIRDHLWLAHNLKEKFLTSRQLSLDTCLFGSRWWKRRMKAQGWAALQSSADDLHLLCWSQPNSTPHLLTMKPVRQSPAETLNKRRQVWWGARSRLHLRAREHARSLPPSLLARVYVGVTLPDTESQLYFPVCFCARSFPICWHSASFVEICPC